MLFMATNNTNGYYVDETLEFLNFKNIPCYNPVQYPKFNSDFTFDSMAPLTVGVNNSHNTITQTKILQTATKKEPENSISSSSNKSEMDKPDLLCFNDICEMPSVDSAESLLRKLSARCSEAERKALRIKYRINCHRRRKALRGIGCLSDITESSSEDESTDINEHLESSIRNRIAARCHWFSLQLDKKIAMERIADLRKRRKAFRKSDIYTKTPCDNDPMRTRSYEASLKPRHHFHHLSSPDLDSSYPGNDIPNRSSHPCWNYMRLYCRPKLDGDATDPKHSVYSEVVERSLAVDRPKCQTPVNEDIVNRKRYLSGEKGFKPRPRESHPSGSSGVSSLGSLDDQDRVPPSSGSFSRTIRAPLNIERKRKLDFSAVAPTRTLGHQRFYIDVDDNSIVPRFNWKKQSYPSPLSTERDSGTRRPQNAHKYREHSLTSTTNYHQQLAFEKSNGGIQEVVGSRKRKLSSTLPSKFPCQPKRPHQF